MICRATTQGPIVGSRSFSPIREEICEKLRLRSRDRDLNSRVHGGFRAPSLARL